MNEQTISAYMKAEFMNPFVFGILRVLASEAKLAKSVPTKPGLVMADATMHAVNVVIGVVGTVQGLVIYGMDLSTAKGIIKAMAGMEIPMTDPMAESALSELGNLITGLASSGLEGAGYPCRISPPALVQGTGRPITKMSVPMVVVPISTELGEIKIYLALASNPSAAPANSPGR
ncbi:MAG TPA: chemotaxis protein CheX [Symbiobacteriaceae bacterium]|jgi:chemotaxis protein CheX